jgi:hypothetical protein
MTRSNATLLPGTLRRVLDRYRRRWRGVNFQRGLFLTLALVVGAVGLAVAADRLLRLEPTARAVALGTIAVLFLGSLVWWVIRPIIRRITDRDAAVRVGRHFPDMQEDLVSAVELSNDAQSGSDTMSHGLVVSVLDRIAGRAQSKVDPRRAVSLKPMFLAGLAMVVMAGILAGAYIVRPESVYNALMRLFQPTQSIPYYSYTKIDGISPGDQVIRRGDTAELIIALSGKVPESVRLEAKAGNTPVRATLACENAKAEWKSGALFEDFTYRIVAGDALSDWYHIRVVPPPSLHGKSAIVTDPAYAGGDVNTRTDLQGSLDLIEGQTVVLLGEPLDRGADAKFACQGILACGADQFPLKIDEKGCLRSPLLEPKKSGEYVAMLTDGFGLQSRTPDSTFIKVREDAKPQVVISEPARDLLLLPGEEAVVSIEAHDEFGMRGLVLAQRRVVGQDPKAEAPKDPEAGPWNRKTLKEGGVHSRELKDKVRLDITALGLVPGDTLEYQAESADFAGDEVHRRSTSPVWRVAILSENQHMEMIENRLRELQTELKQRAAEQRTEAAKLEALQTKAAKESITGEAQEAKDRESTVKNATEDTARKFAALLPDLARNQSAPIETMAELGRLTDAVKAVAAKPMTQAEKNLGEAAQNKAGEQSPNLQKAEASEKSAADRLDELAGATERLARSNALNKLAGDAERLAARQRDLKQTTEGMAPKTAGRSPSDLPKEDAENLDRLAGAERNIEKGIEDLAKSLEQAASSMSYSSPSDAEAAQQAGGKLQQNKTADKAGALAGQMQKNTLFSSLPAHDQIANELSDLAKQLKAAAGNNDQSDPMEQITKEIEQFISRQREINTDTEGLIKKPDPKVSADKQGDRQASLGRDVSEEAAALKELADEIEDFDSKGAESLRKAAEEMKTGANDLYASKMPDGLDHGKKALDYLQEAKDDVIEDGGGGGGGGGMANAQQMRKRMAAMLLLMKTVAAQKKINRDTSGAAEERITDTEAFNRKMNDLAGRQSGARQDARRLEEMVKDDPAADQIALAGGKMDSSRLALAGGDPGPETRKVQAQVLAILEQFLKSQKPPKKPGEGTGDGVLVMMMLQMMMGNGPGQQPGGFDGGENAPLDPSKVGRVDDESWRTTRGRFDDHLSEGSQENIPVQFRDILNSYFDRLRKEPPR